MGNNARDKAAQEERFADIFALLREQDIEQFYAHYQLWVLRRRVPLLERELETLREHLAENRQILETLRPSALALAVLVRLQSNGVSDTDVLDLMLDRGEDWLDRMMQRLDYCEQVEDFIQGDYTQWCIKSLEGAYDWIDSLLGSIKEEKPHLEKSGSETIATEALLLQKLSLDDEEAMLEVTFKHSSDEDNSELATVQSTPADAPEQISLPGEHLPELLESDAIEQLPEPPGWKDLEDLEAPPGNPAPWYSVNVTENGASFTTGSEQPMIMDDWIEVLHADNVARIEAGEAEAVTYSAAEVAESAENENEQTTGEIPLAIDEPALITLEQETETPASTETESSREEAQTLTLETRSDTDETAPTTDEQTTLADPIPTEDEVAFTADEQAIVIDPPPTEDEAALTADEQPLVTELAAAEDEVASTADEQTVLAELVTADSTTNEQTEMAEPSSEIETAAILNDILSLEGEQEEQEEQMAWYELLELEERATAVAHAATEEHVEPGEADRISPVDPGTSEAGEAQDETGKSELESNETREEGSPVPDTSVVTDEARAETDASVTIDDEAHMEADTDTPADDEAHVETDASVTTDDEVDAETDASATTEAAESSEAAVFTLDTIAEMQSAGVLNVYATFAEAEANARAEKPLPGWSEPSSTSFSLPELTEEAAPFIQSDFTEATRVESATVLESQQTDNGAEGRVEAIVEQVTTRMQVVEETPHAQPAIASEKPPKKPGFWRRLFSFGRKNRG